MPLADVAPLDALADACEAVRRTTPSPGALADLRRRAFERFSALGLPTTRLERWRFTNVAPIAGTAFSLAAAGRQGRGRRRTRRPTRWPAPAPG